MRTPRPLIIGIVAVILGLTGGLAFGSLYDISIRTRPAQPVDLPRGLPDGDRGATPHSPLALRLVDSGGIGVPLAGEWGTDYSHDLRAFREAILEEPPYVDAAAFRRIEGDWHAYVDRMRAYGNNAITIPLLLELIDFDRVTRSAGGSPVYEPGSPFLARHAAVRAHFAPLFEWTRQRGMQVFLTTDMLALTPSLAEALRRLAPDSGAVGIDASNPAVWDVYRAGFDELFDKVPIDGVVVRFGEGGRLYNTVGWPYRSEMAIRTAASLRTMLRGLLPVFEARQKILVLRSWTVGIGRLGRLHLDPRVYDETLGDIDSPALVVSTKFTAGDFFSYLPLNPTLYSGRHRRLVELQAKPEFEGFGAFPNFLGEDHAHALRTFRSVNPRIAGTYLLTQFGGPLRAGPRTLYPLHGFWQWTDANVFVSSQLALDPATDVRELTTRWARATFRDQGVVDAVVDVLVHSREAVLEGFYIRSFAEREVRVRGLELPPLMWIFEWDMVGGWHSLLSLVYRASRDDVDVSLAEGRSAADLVRGMRAQLQAAVERAPACGPVCTDALRSLEYQETLFDALAAWRQTFLRYYQWLDTGSARAWAEWRDARGQFTRAAAHHVERFGREVDFPAFDLTSATRAVSVAQRGGWQRFSAGAMLIGVIALLVIGGALSRLTWTVAAFPWRLKSAPVDLPSSMALTTLTLLMVGLLAGSLTGFTTLWTPLGSMLLVSLVTLAFVSTGTPDQETRGRLLAGSMGALLPGSTALLAMMVYAGPLGFWYWFWTSVAFRVAFLTCVIVALIWTAYVMFEARSERDWRGRSGGMLAAAGAGLLGLTFVLPDWLHVLRSLDRPLNAAPATETMLFALQTYAGVTLDISGGSYAVGALLVGVGYIISFRSRGQVDDA